MSKTKPSLRLKLSLLAKFSLMSFFILAAIGIALGWGIQRHFEKVALQQEAENAIQQVSTFLNKRLKSTDFQGPFDPARLEEIEGLVRENVLSPHIVRIKIWNRDGQVIYSDKKELVGRRFPIEGELKEALNGKIAMEISDLKKEENVSERGLYSRLMEIYVPLRTIDSPQVAGAYEIYHELSVLEPHIAEMRLYVWSSIALGFFILYGSLFWIVRNASRELIHRNDENTRLYGEVKQQLVERRAAEEKYRSIFENAVEGIFQTTSDGHYLSVNPALVRMHGYDSPEELMETNTNIQHQVYVDPDRRVKFKHLLETQGEVRGFESQFFRKDGSTFWVSMNARAIRDGSGALIFDEGTVEDITERKRAEEILKQSEENARQLAQENAVMAEIGRIISSTLNIDEVYESFSKEVKQIISFDRIVINFIDTEKSTVKNVYISGKRLQDRNVRDVYPLEGSGNAEMVRTKSTLLIQTEDFNEFQDRFPTLLSTFQAGFRSIMNVPLFSKGKIIGGLLLRSRKPYAYTDKDVRLAERIGSQIAGAIANAQLYAERIQAEKERAALEEQLRQSQKMEAIGQLAGGIAHDFNNLLTVISGYSEFSLRELQGDSDLRENLEEIKKAARRASDLTRQLLAFSRRQILEMEVLDLNTVLGDLDKMLCRMIGEHIELVTTFSENLGRIKTDRGQIEQVIMNLAINARDAMPSGGKIIIGTTNVELDEDYAHKHTAVKPGRYVMLSVSDTGVGMTPEVRDRIFEPFFTTKEKGKGTGLGLSTVYGIVKQSGGNIWVYSEPGHGTTFKIYLPIMDEPFEEAVERKVSKELPGGSETVLIVEDDKEVRMLAMRILKTQGYRVLEASHGGDALRVLEEWKGPIDLMVTDVVMPEMSGRELANRLIPFHPKIKVLFMSGYTDNAIVHHGVLDKGINYIQKPFTMDGLGRKVREVLDH